MQGKKDYQEKLFIRFQLSDYVPPDNFYRQLKGILDLNFLYQSTAEYYGKEGQKSIDPVVFMKLMLVGYIENIHSDRRIVSNSRMRMDILYFLGYDLDEELPWHSTLSRTRKLYGEEQFMAIFKQVLKLCIDQGLISGRRQAVDSVLVQANASVDSMVEKQIMEDAIAYSKELDANSEAENRPEVVPFKAKPQTELKKNGKPKYSNQTHYSKADPDAKISFKPGKPFDLYYRGQVSVDTESYFITHVQAFHANRNDSTCFPEIIQHTVQNLKENHLQIEEVLADSGYSSGEALQTLADHNLEGYIPTNTHYKGDRDGFTYHVENDTYTCSRGIQLTFRRFKKWETDISKSYKSRVKDCKDCPIRDACLGSKNCKEIVHSVHKPLYDRMRQRMETKQAKRMVRLRHCTVEPVIGSLINYTGMKRINPRGIKQANKCMIMAAVVYNLKKFFQRQAKKVQNNINASKTNLKCAINNSLQLYYGFIGLKPC